MYGSLTYQQVIELLKKVAPQLKFTHFCDLPTGKKFYWAIPRDGGIVECRKYAFVGDISKAYWAYTNNDTGRLYDGGAQRIDGNLCLVVE